jgi:hypothetical protein
MTRIERVEYVRITKWTMTDEEFEKATGNPCKTFIPNYFTDEVI